MAATAAVMVAVVIVIIGIVVVISATVGRVFVFEGVSADGGLDLVEGLTA